jgi:hypothetical protein
LVAKRESETRPASRRVRSKWPILTCGGQEWVRLGRKTDIRIESAYHPTTDIAGDGRLLAPGIEPRDLSFVKIPRDHLLCAGRALAWPSALVDRVLDDLKPLWESVERARGRIDDDLTQALVALATDIHFADRQNCETRITRWSDGRQSVSQSSGVGGGDELRGG